MDTAPLTFERTLRCPPERAFETYADRIGEWWDPQYSANPETLKAVTIEPRVGGRIYATHSDLGEVDWGRVTAWEPGRLLVHSFTLAQDARSPSEVSAEFLTGGNGCTLRFVHGGWSESNAGHRAKFGDWPLLLDRFAALAEES